MLLIYLSYRDLNVSCVTLPPSTSVRIPGSVHRLATGFCVF
nr:MAG TPA: hypothetical protein [Caudoviricetes sp.]